MKTQKINVGMVLALSKMTDKPAAKMGKGKWRYGLTVRKDEDGRDEDGSSGDAGRREWC